MVWLREQHGCVTIWTSVKDLILSLLAVCVGRRTL